MHVHVYVYTDSLSHVYIYIYMHLSIFYHLACAARVAALQPLRGHLQQQPFSKSMWDRAHYRSRIECTKIYA